MPFLKQGRFGQTNRGGLQPWPWEGTEVLKWGTTPPLAAEGPGHPTPEGFPPQGDSGLGKSGKGQAPAVQRGQRDAKVS